MDEVAEEIVVEDEAPVPEGLSYLPYQRAAIAFAAKFAAATDGAGVDVRSEAFGDDAVRLYREPELGDRWVASLRRSGHEQRVLLYDQGLEELLVTGLGLPRPDPAP